MQRKPLTRQRSTGWLPACLCGLLAFVLSASFINHGLVDSPLPAGPGLTTDESINIRQGVFLFESFLQFGPLMMLPGSSDAVYSSPSYMADYVPLGRFLLGMSHGLTAWMISGAESSVFNVPAARLASCFAFAVTTMLIALFCFRRYGTSTSILAALLFVLMPRVVGHSRLASLETLTSLAWFAALLPLLSWWTSDRPPTNRQAMISGLMWGLLMLVKIQAVFLPPVITVFAFAMFRGRALRPLSIMAVTGLAVFYGGWPWLWLDPVNHTRSYLMSTTDRLPVNNWYLGQRYVDKATPWHYPLVMLALTIPLHILAGLVLRMFRRKPDSVEWLLLVSIVVPLFTFCLPGTPVYDGIRLFLIVTPAIAILSARGIQIVLREPFGAASTEIDGSSSATTNKLAAGVVGIVLLFDAALTVPNLGPFAGNFWNQLADAIDPDQTDLEANYWGDGLNSDFWNAVPHGSTVAVAPVLHPVLLQDMQNFIPLIQERHIKLEPFYYDPEEQRGLVLLLHRFADLPPGLRRPPVGSSPLMEVRSNGRVLATLVDTRDVTWQERPEW